MRHMTRGRRLSLGTVVDGILHLGVVPPSRTSDLGCKLLNEAMTEALRKRADLANGITAEAAHLYSGGGGVREAAFVREGWLCPVFISQPDISKYTVARLAQLARKRALRALDRLIDVDINAVH